MERGKRLECAPSKETPAQCLTPVNSPGLRSQRHKLFAGIDHHLTQYGLCHFGLPASGLANQPPCALIESFGTQPRGPISFVIGLLATSDRIRHRICA